MSEETTTIRVPREVYTALQKLKETLGLRSIGDAARILFSVGESPLALVAILFDMRNDFKRMLSLLEKLNKNLERLLAHLEKWEARIPRS